MNVPAPNLMQLPTANILSNRKRVTGRKGVSEGFIEAFVCKFPFPYFELSVSLNEFFLDP
jgi:hypothetical protein